MPQTFPCFSVLILVFMMTFLVLAICFKLLETNSSTVFSGVKPVLTPLFYKLNF